MGLPRCHLGGHGGSNAKQFLRVCARAPRAMNCLPILDRELRVAARKRSTFWLRVVAAATVVALAGGALAMSGMSRVNVTQMGDTLFHLLSWLCLLAGLSAGIFFTSDCLSEEKREGTLGLLFLADLRGYDVALGKLLATSLRAFYALLAVLPIMAITLLMGGVTIGQYWKTCFALVNALVVSLAAGMVVSASSRDSQKALTATFLLVLLMALGGPLVDGLVAYYRHRPFQPFWSVSSPAYVLSAATAWGRSAYWSALITTQFMAWAMLALASALVPHTWQERKRAGGSTAASWTYRWRYGGPRRQRRLRRKLLERWPATWLSCRERWQSRALWALAVLAVGLFVILLVENPPGEAWIFFNYVGGLFTLLLYVWAASQASRFFVEARRSGLLELLLVSPLSESQIVRGQWQGWLRMFGLPVALLLAADVAASTLSQLGFQRVAAQASTASTVTTTNQSGVVISYSVSISTSNSTLAKRGTNAAPATAIVKRGPVPTLVGVAVSAALASALSTGANLLALCWFGLWMGMTSRSANQATLKTLLFVQVIPWFVILFATPIVMGSLVAAFTVVPGQPSNWFAWWPLLSALFGAAVALVKDVGFISWSVGKLASSLRAQAACTPGQPRFATPPRVPMATGAAPSIPAIS
jgi:ABC-type transport system involved in multi-copper enzyme maturation permease subunit